MSSETTKPSAPLHAIVIVQCEQDDDDYTVAIERPDGSQIRIVIPRETSDGFPNKCVSESTEPFGLNLVTQGHYG